MTYMHNLDRLHAFEQHGDKLTVIKFAHIAPRLHMVGQKWIGDFTAHAKQVDLKKPITMAGGCAGVRRSACHPSQAGWDIALNWN